MPADTPTPSSSVRASPASSPPPNWSRPASASSIVEQEPEASFGGQAWWSFGGLFLVDSPEQRRMGIKDSPRARAPGLVRQRRLRPRRRRLAARVGRGLPRLRRRREARVAAPPRASGSSPSSAGPSAAATPRPGHGNSVPRFHIVWGTGPGVARAVHQDRARGRRRRASSSCSSGTASTSSSSRRRGRRRARRRSSPRTTPRAGSAEQPRRRRRVRARGAGRRSWRAAASAATTTSCASTGRSGSARRPKTMLSGVPAHVDGRMLGDHREGGRPPRQRRPDVALRRGHRELRARSGPSTASGSCPARRASGSTRPASACRCRCSPASTPSAPSSTCARPATTTPGSCSPRAIIEKEFALSGSEQNPDLTARASASCCKQRLGKGATEPVEAFKEKGADFVVADTLDELFAGMRKLSPEGVELDTQEIRARDRGARPRDRQRLHEGRADHRHPRRAQLPRRQAHPGGEAAQDPRPGAPAR